MFFLINLTITIYKCFTNRLKYVIIVDMDEDKIIMTEVQTDMMDLLLKYEGSFEQTIAMCFKMVVDCYVMQMGEEETQKFLKHAVESVKSGNHSHLYENLPKNLIN